MAPDAFNLHDLRRIVTKVKTAGKTIKITAKKVKAAVKAIKRSPNLEILADNALAKAPSWKAKAKSYLMSPVSPDKKLHYDIHHEIFSYLNPTESACLGVTCKKFYDLHIRIHGTKVPLGNSLVPYFYQPKHHAAPILHPCARTRILGELLREWMGKDRKLLAFEVSPHYRIKGWFVYHNAVFVHKDRRAVKGTKNGTIWMDPKLYFGLGDHDGKEIGGMEIELVNAFMIRPARYYHSDEV